MLNVKCSCQYIYRNSFKLFSYVSAGFLGEYIFKLLKYLENVVAQWDNVCKTLVGSNPLEEFKLYCFLRSGKQCVALNYTTQHTLPQDYGGKWRKNLNGERTRFPIPSGYTTIYGIQRGMNL